MMVTELGGINVLDWTQTNGDGRKARRSGTIYPKILSSAVGP
jgi:hypothetical protein